MTPAHRLLVASLIGGSLACSAVVAGQSPAQTRSVAMKDSQGASVGTATLQDSGNGVLVTLDLRGLPPGVHAVHFHEVGRCDGPSFDSAGEHVSSGGEVHGVLAKDGPHAGDLPNVHASEHGTVMAEFMATHVTLARDKAGSLVDEDGSALVVHTKADDHQSNPSGESGDRIACGVLTR